MQILYVFKSFNKGKELHIHCQSILDIGKEEDDSKLARKS